MKLALRLPLNHLQDFAHACDFFYFDYDQLKDKRVKDFLPVKKPVWVSLERHLVLGPVVRLILKQLWWLGWYKKIDCIVVHGSVLTEAQELGRRYGYKGKYAGICTKHKRQLTDLRERCNEVLIPTTKSRASLIQYTNSQTYTYLGYKTLDELRTYPPRGMITAMPIQAALLGYDLLARRRRPKNVPPFDPEVKLNEQQIRTTLRNVGYLRKAVEYGTRA